MYDLRHLAIEWQMKRSRSKRVVMVFVMMLLAVIVSSLWSLMMGLETRWWLMGVVGGVALIGCSVSLSAYTNTSLVAMYYMAQVAAPDKLELLTGTVEQVAAVKMPFVGSLQQVTLTVAGEKARLYCPARLLQGVERDERVRVWSYDLFVVKVEKAVRVEVGDESTQNAS